MARRVGETEDLALLGDLTEEVLLAEIEARYAKDQIYVRDPLLLSLSSAFLAAYLVTFRASDPSLCPADVRWGHHLCSQPLQGAEDLRQNCKLFNARVVVL